MTKHVKTDVRNRACCGKDARPRRDHRSSRRTEDFRAAIQEQQILPKKIASGIGPPFFDILVTFLIPLVKGHFQCIILPRGKMDQKSQYAIETLANLLYLIEVQAEASQDVRHYVQLVKNPLEVLVEAAKRTSDVQ